MGGTVTFRSLFSPFTKQVKDITLDRRKEGIKMKKKERSGKVVLGIFCILCPVRGFSQSSDMCVGMSHDRFQPHFFFLFIIYDHLLIRLDLTQPP
jgi:hypothetical protein